MRRPQIIPLALLLVIFFISSCSSDTFELCDNSEAVDLGPDICLQFEDAGQLNAHRSTIENIVSNTITKINDVMPVDRLLIRIGTNSIYIIPEIGMGGYNPKEQEVILGIDPNYTNLAQAINTELAAILAHEIHHAKRRRFTGYGSTLLQASVSEGLADCFSMEVTEVDTPIWSVAVKGADLDFWIDSASISWDQAPYDHGIWFVGSSQVIPRWVGYSIGFTLVKNYIASNPGAKASELYDEPASSFEP